MTLKRRKIGKTKLEVTTLGLGGAPMGGFRATISDAEAMALTDAAYEAACATSTPRRSTAMAAASCAWARRCARSRARTTCCRPRSAASCTPLKPGEKPPADFRENGLPGFAPEFDYTYDGVMRSLEHSHLRLGLAQDRHRADPRRRFLDHQGPRRPRRSASRR